MNREKERKQLFKDLQASLAREKDGMTMQRRIIDRMVDAAAGDGEADSVQVRLGEIILEKVAGKESPRPAEEKESGPKVIYIGGERREREPAAASDTELPHQQDTPPAELAPPESEPQTPDESVRTDAINGPDRTVRLRRLKERDGGLRGVDGATVNELMRGRDLKQEETAGPICKNLTKRNAGRHRG